VALESVRTTYSGQPLLWQCIPSVLWRHTMQLQVQSTPALENAPIYRHICGWCRRDLCALWCGSQHHSYAICDACKQTYFAGLYDAPALASTAPEKAITRN